jgi:hypothetical protein
MVTGDYTTISTVSNLVERPLFTIKQQQAMSQFFGKYQVEAPADWNAVGDDDPLWGRCVKALEVCYSGRARAPSPCQLHINSRSEELLGNLELLKTLGGARKTRQFFCEHIITTPEELQERTGKFVSGIQYNQISRYTCLIPSNKECIIDETILITDLKYEIPRGGMVLNLENISARLCGRLTSFTETDILLDERMEGLEVPEYDTLPKGGSGCGTSLVPIFGHYTIDAQLSSVVVLPYAMQMTVEAIDSLAKTSFERKFQDLSIPAARKRNVACLGLCSFVVCAALAGCVFSAKALI